MKIWILCTGEPVPFLQSEAGDRFLRAGKIAEYLTQKGHDVTWWTARFDHYSKSFRDVSGNVPIRLSGTAPNMVFLNSCGYSRHIGVRRLVDHWQIGRAFRKLARQQPKPDLILASFPLVELCYEAVLFGQRNGIPVVVDIRDLWPDIIVHRLSRRIGFCAKIIAIPYEILCKHTFRRADRVIAITKGMQRWCYGRFGRDLSKQEADAVVRQFKERPSYEHCKADEQYEFWAKKDIDLSSRVTRLVWTGSIIKATDGPALLDAVKLLPKGIEDHLQIVVAGRGDMVPDIEVVAEKHPCLRYVGWIGNTEMNFLLEHSHIGLLCYLDRFDFQMATPNKIIDYCAAGMRILTNLTGEVRQLSNDDRLVINYSTGDAKSLSKMLVKIAFEHNEFRKKFEPARRVFNDQFDSSHVLPEFETYLLEVIGAAKK